MCPDATVRRKRSPKRMDFGLTFRRRPPEFGRDDELDETAVRVICVDAVMDPRWHELVAARGGGLFHSPAWLGALADTYGFQPRAAIIVDAGENAVAGVSFCRVVDVGGDRIVCSPFSDFCDPLADPGEQWGALRSALVADGRSVTCRWRDHDDGDAGGDLLLTRRARWHGIEIESSLDALRRQVAPAARRAVRRAEREGVCVGTLDDSHLDDFVRLHVALRKRKYRQLAQPRAFFAAIRDRFQNVDSWFPLAARYRGRIIAVTIYLRWRDKLYYKFNASAPETLPLRPNDLLLWEGLRLAHELGCREVDLGATDDNQPGLSRFKRHYGAVEREIRHLRYVPATARTVAATDADLLGRVTALLTDPATPDELTRVAGAAWYRHFV